MFVEIFTVLLLGVQSAPQATQNGPQAQTAPAATTQTAPAAPEARVRCQRVQETGSNRYRRVCQTEAQQQASQDRADRLLDQVRDTRPTSECETNGTNCPANPN